MIAPHLEASWTPVHKLDCSLGLDSSDCDIDIFGHHIPTVEHAASHVLAMTGVTFDHLIVGLKTGAGDLGHGELLVVGLLRGDDGRVGHQGEVDARVGHQVGLEFSQVHIEGPIEAKGGSDGGDNLADETVEVGVRGPLNVQIATADVIDGLIVHHEGTVGVFQGGVGGQDRIVGLHYCCGHLRGWIDSKLQFGLFAVIHGQVFHQ